MTAQQSPRTGSYHVFAPPASTGIHLPLRRILLRAVYFIVAFFGLLVMAVLLIALSPTLSRSVTAFFIGPQVGALPWNGTDPVNMVVVGLDLRQGQTADPHTDTIVVISVNPKSGKIRMLSLPRDLWVSIPGYGYDRINDAYEDGGAPLLIKTVEGVVNLPIRYYTIVNFVGFEKVIDALGGVTINVKQTIRDPTFPAFTGYGYDPLYIKKGVHHMDGALALKYIRTRHDDPLGDLGRNERQQQLLSALKAQVVTPHTLLNMPEILSSLHAAVTTNFPYDDLTYLFRIAMTAGSTHRYLNYANNAVSNYVTADGADVLLPNWPRIHWIAHQTFYDPDLASAGVTVLNGSGVSGEAGSVGHWLHASGYRVDGVGNASREDYRHTIVIRNEAVGGGDFVARMLRDQLQSKVEDERLPEIHSAVVVIVGQDWTSPVQS